MIPGEQESAKSVSDEAITLQAIARVRGGRSAPEDDDWDAVEAVIELLDPYGPEALAGLEDFSHVCVVFLFDQVDPEGVETKARRPRGRADWPEVGIFAQRGKRRPNRLGLTTARILAVEGRRIKVRGLDALDGSPILDLKPHMSGFAPRGPIREPGWARAIMNAYWKAREPMSTTPDIDAAIADLDKDAPLEPLLELILERFQCQVGTVHFLSASSGLLELSAHKGLPDFVVEKTRKIPIGKGMAGLAAERKEPVQVCNLQTDDSGVAKPAAKQTRAEGSIAIPMLIKDRVVGTLGVAKRVAYDFSPDEQSALLAIASKIGEARG